MSKAKETTKSAEFAVSEDVEAAVAEAMGELEATATKAAEVKPAAKKPAAKRTTTKKPAAKRTTTNKAAKKDVAADTTKVEEIQGDTPKVLYKVRDWCKNCHPSANAKEEGRTAKQGPQWAATYDEEGKAIWKCEKCGRESGRNARGLKKAVNA
jgi:hypothetical protein